MYLVWCSPLTVFYNSSDSIVNHLIYKIGGIKMNTQLFFCEFKGYIATAFNIAELELDHNDLDCLFDIYMKRILTVIQACFILWIAILTSSMHALI